MSAADGTMPIGVEWTFAAWSESFTKGREGAPSIWSTYAFDTQAEATKERDRLERQWSEERWKKQWGEWNGPYRFEVYRVETTHVPRDPVRRPAATSRGGRKT